MGEPIAPETGRDLDQQGVTETIAADGIVQRGLQGQQPWQLRLERGHRADL